MLVEVASLVVYRLVWTFAEGVPVFPLMSQYLKPAAVEHCPTLDAFTTLRLEMREDVSDFWKRERARRRGLIEQAGGTLWSSSARLACQEEEQDWTQYALSMWTKPFLIRP